MVFPGGMLLVLWLLLAVTDLAVFYTLWIFMVHVCFTLAAYVAESVRHPTVVCLSVRLSFRSFLPRHV